MATRFGATIAIAGIMLTSVCWIHSAWLRAAEVIRCRGRWSLADPGVPAGDLRSGAFRVQAGGAGGQSGTMRWEAMP
jgi:hypothetical protein